MPDSTIVAALRERAKPMAPGTATKRSDLVLGMILGRLEQCYPGCRKNLGYNCYELDLRASQGELYRLRIRVAAKPRDYFWNNATEAFIQSEILVAQTDGAAPFVLACLLGKESDRLHVWQIDMRELLDARQRAHVDADVSSYRILLLEGKWRLRYRGILLDLDVAGTHIELPLGAEEKTAILALKDSVKAAQKVTEEGAEEEDDEEDDEEDAPVDDAMLQRMREAVQQRGQIILQGPPGTGKTYYAMQFVDLCCGTRGQPDAERRKAREQGRFTPGVPKSVYASGLNGRETAWALVQFHPSYSYEDFVRGVVAEPGKQGQPVFRAKDKLFGALCAWAAEKVEGRRAILIIDEINRADVARVFGELVMGIEADKRGEPIATPHAVRREDGTEDTTLIIPPNLWIVGTMNTADRSVVRFDMALRRRFSFIDILAEVGALESYFKGQSQLDEPDWPEKKKRIHEAVELYRAVREMFTRDGTWNSHGREHALGPSFFMVPLPSAQKDFRFRRSLRDRIELEVLPQLQEYRAEGVPLEQAGRQRFAKLLREFEVFVPGRTEDADFYNKYGDFLGVPRPAPPATGS